MKLVLFLSINLILKKPKSFSSCRSLVLEDRTLTDISRYLFNTNTNNYNSIE